MISVMIKIHGEYNRDSESKYQVIHSKNNSYKTLMYDRRNIKTKIFVHK